jgi:hypothetical protein
VLDEVVTADKEIADKRAVEEAAVKKVAEKAAMKRAAEERTAVEAEVKKVVEEAAVKAAAAEAAGAAGGSLTPDQAPSTTGTKRVVAPSGSTPPAKRPYRGVWKPRFVQLSLPLFSLFCGTSFSYYPFCPGPLPPA